MSITPPALVVGAARAPLPYGLFSVLAFRDGSTDSWEGGGVQFESLGTPPAEGAIGPYDCEDPSETVGLPKVFEGGLNISEALPFTVYGSYKCSPIGNPLGHAQDVARARLDAWEEFQAERALWFGGLGSSPSFVGSTPTELGTLDLVEGIAQIESALASSYAALGVIHVGRGTAIHLLKNKVIESKGTRLFTLLGTPVIAGSGYGEGEAYATPALLGYRSEVFTSSNVAGDLLDRASNDLYAVAERNYLIGYDDMPNILHATLTASSGGGGAAGKSAYEIAVDNGFVGTEPEWLESLIGSPGTPATITSVTATGLAAGAAPTVTAGGTPSARTLAFGIPAGATGGDGTPATITAVTAVALAPGATPTVLAGGTASARTFQFGIPEGEPGVPGVVQDIVAGEGIAVNSTDPANPVISAAP